MGSPVRMCFIARFLPSSLVSFCVPPIPGMSPKVISGSPILALSERTKISHKSAVSSPPPKAIPFTPAMMGFLMLPEFLQCIPNDEQYSWKISLPIHLEQPSEVLNSFISTPAQNAFGLLLKITITLTVLLASKSARPAAMSFLIWWLRALRFFGLLRYRIPTVSLWSRMTRL